MIGTLSWERDGRDWPNRAASRFVQAAGVRWHVQVMGRGPVVLLVHGTGAATHSWRDVAPALARHCTVVAPDLPGHGFTEALPTHRQTLPGMAHGLDQLLRVLNLAPEVAVGHSAGAAVLARMALDGRIAPAALISLNGALLPLRAMPETMFSPLARLLARLPPVPWLVAWRAVDRGMVERLLAGTGSTIDAAGVAQYARLVRSPGHVAGALSMMAGWSLELLAADLPRLTTPLVLVVGTNDRTVPPAESERVHTLVPGSTLIRLPGLGHLAHEERPDEVAALILRSLAHEPVS